MSPTVHVLGFDIDRQTQTYYRGRATFQHYFNLQELRELLPVEGKVLVRSALEPQVLAEIRQLAAQVKCQPIICHSVQMVRQRLSELLPAAPTTTGLPRPRDPDHVLVPVRQLSTPNRLNPVRLLSDIRAVGAETKDPLVKELAEVVKLRDLPNLQSATAEIAQRMRARSTKPRWPSRQQVEQALSRLMKQIHLT